MRILIIGNSKGTEILTNFLSEDESLLVFTTKENTLGNFINIKCDDVEELKEFALANEINLTIVADISLFNIDYISIFSANNLAILMPDSAALQIACEKAFGKKFIYRNKIKTPKFAFFEKPALATEYARNSIFPIVIKPDEHSDIQTAYIAETFGAAKKQIEKLFQNDNKKILIEEYIYGKELTYYVLSDGFNPIILDSIQTYRNELSIKDADNNDLDERIYNEIIFPTVSNLAEAGCEYIGILGFDIIVTPDNEAYLIEYNPFFKDLDIELTLKGTNENWPKLFMDTIIGTLTDNFETPFSIHKKDEYFGTFINNDDEIIFESAKTKNMLKTKLLEEGLKKEIFDEAQKMWKI